MMCAASERVPSPASSAACIIDIGGSWPWTGSDGAWIAWWASAPSMKSHIAWIATFSRRSYPVISIAGWSGPRHAPGVAPSPPATTTLRAPGRMSSGRKPSGTRARKASAPATPTTRAPASNPTRFTASTTPSVAIRVPTIRPSAGGVPRRRIARPRWTSAASARPPSPACWSSARVRAPRASRSGPRSSASIARRRGRRWRRAWPGVRGGLVVDTRALFMSRSPRVHRSAAVGAAGRALASVDALARLAAAVRPDDAATIVYTSGTTGPPKGALYRHGQHLAACANILAHYPVLTDGEHRVVAMLPLCHTMGRNTVITMPLLADIVPHYPESLATVAESLYEVAPTFVFTVPRYLQKFAAHLLVGIDASTTLKRAAYHAALRLGARAVSRGATALPGRDERGGVWGRLSRGATALPGRDERGGVGGASSGPPLRLAA